MKDRNHEGYHDPTACEAVRRVERENKRNQAARDGNCDFIYRIGETRGFQNVDIKLKTGL